MIMPKQSPNEPSLQIAVFDKDIGDGKDFFDSGLGCTWFDYDLHLFSRLEQATYLLEINNRPDHPACKETKLDLLLVSNRIWLEGGEQLVRAIRKHPRLNRLPIFLVASCNKKLVMPQPECWDTEWRASSNCDRDARIAAIPFERNLASDHPAHLNGIVCANNLAQTIPRIVDQLSEYWFQF